MVIFWVSDEGCKLSLFALRNYGDIPRAKWNPARLAGLCCHRSWRQPKERHWQDLGFRGGIPTLETGRLVPSWIQVPMAVEMKMWLLKSNYCMTTGEILVLPAEAGNGILTWKSCKQRISGVEHSDRSWTEESGKAIKARMKKELTEQRVAWQPLEFPSAGKLTFNVWRVYLPWSWMQGLRGYQNQADYWVSEALWFVINKNIMQLGICRLLEDVWDKVKTV